MDFRSMTVKEVFENPETAAAVKELVPSLTKYPIKLFYKKTCGEVFDLVVSKKLVTEEQAKQVEAKINEIVK